MPEAEDVITDAARHATIYARELWRRHRSPEAAAQASTLRDFAQRLDMLVTAAFGASYPIRVAQPPAPASFLTKMFRRHEGPRVQAAIPATDGASLWLPARLPDVQPHHALEWYRVLAMQQAMRASRGSPAFIGLLENELQRAAFTALEAQAADQALVRLLPGTRAGLENCRASLLARRPALKAFPAHRRPLEEFVRSLLADLSAFLAADSPGELAGQARALAAEMAGHMPPSSRQGAQLFRDLWTGELYAPPPQDAWIAQDEMSAGDDGTDPRSPRSARLARRPDVRKPAEDEDDARPGAWMVQTSQPHEQVEDPVGMQRPTDRDESTAAEEFADALSELPEARLVSTPGKPKEVLLSDDAPGARTRQGAGAAVAGNGQLQYPEWDYRIAGSRDPGVTVRLQPPTEGPQDWVDRTLDSYRSMRNVVQRHFEMLRAQRLRLRKQLDGEEIDLEAYVDGHADFRAGAPMAQALYQTCRPARRDMAIMLLIDISGSTDAWISADKRIIDVEREALLLVSIALQGLSEPYAIMGFSGEGPHGVTIRTVKSFDEVHGNEVARRIAALEPEHYTRAGAAIRHASAELMRQAARHRLLLLLSDGKPNDIDDYEGQYGVEDMRQAVTEARLQGMHSFCLTIDRQAASYLPAVFGARQYALLPRPEMLPLVLLEWMKRLVLA